MLVLLFLAGAVSIMCGFRDQGVRVVRFAIAAGFLLGLVQPACHAGYTSITESLRALSVFTSVILGIGYVSAAVFVVSRLLRSKHFEKELMERERARTRERPRLPAPPADDEVQP